MSGKTPAAILEPSRGGSGIRLNTASIILIVASTKNALLTYSIASVSGANFVIAATTRQLIKANNKFEIGPAAAVITVPER